MTLEEPHTLTKPSPTSSTMSKKLNAEELAAKRSNVLSAEIYVNLPKPVNEPTAETVHRRVGDWKDGYATAIREEVEPRDRLLQELVDYLQRDVDGWVEPRFKAMMCEEQIALLAKAKEQFGITPKP